MFTGEVGQITVSVGRPAVRQTLGALRTEAIVVTTRGEGTAVRVQPARRTITLGPGDHVHYRPATPAERVELLDEGVGLAVLETADGVQLLALDLVPSETQMMQLHGVARETARMAVRLSAAEGWVFTIPSRGTFASPRERRPERP
ncbi:gntR family transcriptional regulator [Planomonospora sphaerica]|uniref:GntR family transcriptional regulator n=1 Tax=Planomonospora sphaerica TaxID=161355 RepID=A0A161LGW0_9ACTN|nr:GntR family transcriptional regulator [Planomonospora sphaerica]GAT66714.1 gntR family transcriptional regulator [Planomonospora sphaerica]